MRVAVILESKLQAGGGFQQELSTARLLARRQGAHDFVFYTPHRENLGVLKEHGLTAVFLDMRSWKSRVFFYAQKLKKLAGSSDTGDLAMAPFEKVLHRDGTDLVYFLSSSQMAAYVRRLNYLVTAWDQCHRDHLEFPEVNFEGQFEQRENFYKTIAPKAVAILVDAPTSKDNLVKRYGCDAARIHVAPFFPPEELSQAQAGMDVPKKYGIKRRYIFYPAQFWAHKNHVYVLDGLALLKQKYGIEMDVVFSGSDKGNLSFVLAYARKLGLQDAVHYVGFVPYVAMASFYGQALALVMPTYFGLTNIPPLEAFALGCPVCYPDLPGLRDQVGDAAFLMDLKDPGSMATQVMAILNDKGLVAQKVIKGKAIVARWTGDDYWDALKGIFDAYAVKQHCWKDVRVSGD